MPGQAQGRHIGKEQAIPALSQRNVQGCSQVENVPVPQQLKEIALPSPTPIAPAADRLTCQHLQPCLQFLTPAEPCVSLIYIPNSWMWKRDKLLVILSVSSSSVVQESTFVWEYHIVKQEGGDAFQSVTLLFSPLSLCTAGQSFDCDCSEVMVWGEGEQKEKHCQIWKLSFKPACSSWGVFRDMRHYTSLHCEYQSSTTEYMKGKSLVKQTVGIFC